MQTIVIRISIMLICFVVSFYTLSALRIEHLFRKNSRLQIQLFYFLSSMAMAYLVGMFLLSLRV